MQVFLKEKGKLSLNEMTKESIYYIEAHKKPDNHAKYIRSVNGYIPKDKIR